MSAIQRGRASTGLLRFSARSVLAAKVFFLSITLSKLKLMLSPDLPIDLLGVNIIT